MSAQAVLAPLAARYRRWLSLDADQVLADRDEAEADVRAMQLVLRLERTDPPTWSDALTASCIAATALCLDDRSEPGGEWHDAVAEYIGAHIRKVSRRARAGQWTAVDDLPGITITVGSAEVRAIVPGPVTEVDKRVSKLQVGGTDLPVDLAVDGPAGGASSATALALTVPADLPVTAGKLMAQTGHAGMISAALLAGTDPEALHRWNAAGLPTTIRLASRSVWAELVARAGADDGWDRRLVAVRDAGFTEIAPGTITVIADASAV